MRLQASTSLAGAEAIAAAARSACGSPEVARLIDETCSLAFACLRERERLHDLATRDPLTGLANRRTMEEALQVQLAESARLGRPLAVVLLDLDHFRDYNRRHGHLAGDQALQALATLLAEGERDDVACRYGGDEFVVIMPATTAAEALGRLDPLMRRLADRDGGAADRLPDPVTASIGIAESPTDGTDATALIAAADEAMYRAKQAKGQPDLRAVISRPAAARARENRS
jgi:diguanylate cyclase (GGDEF)-like protein